jgi:hypothetical protein
VPRTKSQYSLAPDSRPVLDPVEIKKLKFKEDVLVRALQGVLKKQKRKRKRITKLPIDLSKSGEFPEPTNETVEQQLQSCKEYLRLLNDCELNESTTKARTIIRQVREAREPLVRGRAAVQELRKQQEMALIERLRAQQKGESVIIDEGFLTTLGSMALSGAARAMDAPAVPSILGKLYRAGRTTKRARALRAITSAAKAKVTKQPKTQQQPDMSKMPPGGGNISAAAYRNYAGLEPAGSAAPAASTNSGEKIDRKKFASMLKANCNDISRM